jgi:hypothetical protein
MSMNRRQFPGLLDSEWAQMVREMKEEEAKERSAEVESFDRRAVKNSREPSEAVQNGFFESDDDQAEGQNSDHVQNVNEYSGDDEIQDSDHFENVDLHYGQDEGEEQNEEIHLIGNNVDHHVINNNVIANPIVKRKRRTKEQIFDDDEKLRLSRAKAQLEKNALNESNAQKKEVPILEYIYINMNKYLYIFIFFFIHTYMYIYIYSNIITY